MSQRLFSIGKVGLFVDAVALGKEKRKNGEEATVLKLTLRCEPFTRELAAAIDDGKRTNGSGGGVHARRELSHRPGRSATEAG